MGRLPSAAPFIQMLNSVRMIAALAAMMIVVSCAIVPADVPVVRGTPSATFSLAGRISVRNGQQVEIAQVRWQRNARSEEVLLMTPLGSIVAKLSRQSGQPATLWTAKESVTADSMDALAREALGTTVPISALGWWLQGLSADGRTRLNANPFQHDGWEVSLEQFEVLAGQSVARRVNAVRGDVVVRLIVDEWHPAP